MARLGTETACLACRKSMTLSQDLFAGSRETPKQAKDKLVTAASVMFFGGVLLLALYVNLLRPEGSGLDFVGSFILLPIPVLGMLLGLYLFLSSFTKKRKFGNLIANTFFFLFFGGIAGFFLTVLFWPAESQTYHIAWLVFLCMPLLGGVLLLCEWVYICCLEFRHKGESESFVTGMGVIGAGMGVLFWAVAIPAIGFVAWSFFDRMQDSWRDTAELKKATVELLEETKKQNRAVGIK